MNKTLIIFACAILLTACSSVPYHGATRQPVKVSDTAIDMSDTTRVKKILNQQYNDWHHVKHRMGGLSKKGIDCSGLVYRTYRTRLGVDMPRSTEYQSRMGREITQQQVRAGDLVFFKTGLFSRHVGMYMEKGKFLHVSASKGVMISNLNDPYWKRTYWKARRIE